MKNEVRNGLTKSKHLSRQEAERLAYESLGYLLPHIMYGTVVGSYRRHLHDPAVQEFKDVDLLVIPAGPLPSLPSEWPVDVFTTTRESFEPSLVHWLLGKHILRLKQRAKQRGWKLNRYGLWTAPDAIPILDAMQIYEQLDAGPLPGYLREELDRWREHFGRSTQAEDEAGGEHNKSASYWRRLYDEIGDIFSPEFAVRNADVAELLYADDLPRFASGLLAAIVRRRWERAAVAANTRRWVEYFRLHSNPADRYTVKWY